MLTERQKEFLEYISAYIEAEGFAPSYEEMMRAAGLRSKSGIHSMVKALEERGFIRRLPHRARAIELVPMQSRFARCEKCGHAIGVGGGRKDKIVT